MESRREPNRPSHQRRRRRLSFHGGGPGGLRRRIAAVALIAVMAPALAAQRLHDERDYLHPSELGGEPAPKAKASAPPIVALGEASVVQYVAFNGGLHTSPVSRAPIPPCCCRIPDRQSVAQRVGALIDNLDLLYTHMAGRQR